jgi:hypothetical protein
VVPAGGRFPSGRGADDDCRIGRAMSWDATRLKGSRRLVERPDNINLGEIRWVNCQSCHRTPCEFLRRCATVCGSQMVADRRVYSRTIARHSCLSDRGYQLLHQLQHAPLFLAQFSHQPAQFPHLSSVSAMHRAVDGADDTRAADPAAAHSIASQAEKSPGFLPDPSTV